MMYLSILKRNSGNNRDDIKNPNASNMSNHEIIEKMIALCQKKPTKIMKVDSPRRNSSSAFKKNSSEDKINSGDDSGIEKNHSGGDCDYDSRVVKKSSQKRKKAFKRYPDSEFEILSDSSTDAFGDGFGTDVSEDFVLKRCKPRIKKLRKNNETGDPLWCAEQKSDSRDFLSYAMFRQRNNLASRKSRLNRKLYQAEIEEQLTILESENTRLTSELNQMEAMVERFSEALLKLSNKPKAQLQLLVNKNGPVSNDVPPNNSQECTIGFTKVSCDTSSSLNKINSMDPNAFNTFVSNSSDSNLRSLTNIAEKVTNSHHDVSSSAKLIPNSLIKNIREATWSQNDERNSNNICSSVKNIGASNSVINDETDSGHTIDKNSFKCDVITPVVTFTSVLPKPSESDCKKDNEECRTESSLTNDSEDSNSKSKQFSEKLSNEIIKLSIQKLITNDCSNDEIACDKNIMSKSSLDSASGLNSRNLKSFKEKKLLFQFDKVDCTKKSTDIKKFQKVVAPLDSFINSESDSNYSVEDTLTNRDLKSTVVHKPFSPKKLQFNGKANEGEFLSESLNNYSLKSNRNLKKTFEKSSNERQSILKQTTDNCLKDKKNVLSNLSPDEKASAFNPSKLKDSTNERSFISVAKGSSKKKSPSFYSQPINYISARGKNDAVSEQTSNPVKCRSQKIEGPQEVEKGFQMIPVYLIPDCHNFNGEKQEQIHEKVYIPGNINNLESDLNVNEHNASFDCKSDVKIEYKDSDCKQFEGQVIPDQSGNNNNVPVDPCHVVCDSFKGNNNLSEENLKSNLKNCENLITKFHKERAEKNENELVQKIILSYDSDGDNISESPLVIATEENDDEVSNCHKDNMFQKLDLKNNCISVKQDLFCENSNFRLKHQKSRDKKDKQQSEKQKMEVLLLNKLEEISDSDNVENSVIGKPSYKELRRRNNIASRRSRLKRKLFNLKIAEQKIDLEKRNEILKNAVMKLELQIKKLDNWLINCTKAGNCKIN